MDGCVGGWGGEPTGGGRRKRLPTRFRTPVPAPAPAKGLHGGGSRCPQKYDDDVDDQRLREQRRTVAVAWEVGSD